MGRTGFLPVVGGPIWDANTVETVSSFVGAATSTYTAPSGAYYVIFSSNTNSVKIWLSPDAADGDSGVLFNSNAGDPRWGVAVEPGTVIQIHSAGAQVVNHVTFKHTD